MSDSALVTLESSFQLLSIEAVLFSTLSALFGMFIVALTRELLISAQEHTSSCSSLRSGPRIATSQVYFSCD